MNKVSLSIIVWLLCCACNSNKEKYDASGTFEADEIIVSSEAQGRILRLDPEEGDFLEAGTFVGCVDSVQLHLQRLQLLANNRSVKSREADISTQISALKERIAKQIREKERYSNLLANGAATQKQVDDLSSQLQVLQNELDASVSQLSKGNRSISEESDALSVQVARIEDQLAKCKIVSPISGSVLSKYARAGELATIGTPLFKIADLSRPFLRAYVTSEQLKEVKLGTPVTVFADYGAGEFVKYAGHISYIGSNAEFTPKGIQTDNERANLVYPVKVALQNDGRIKLGMYGHLKF